MTLPPELREKAEKDWKIYNHDFDTSNDFECFMSGVEWLYGELMPDLDAAENGEVKWALRCATLEAKLKAAIEEKDKLYKLLSGEAVDMWCEKPGHNIVLKNFKVSDD